MTSEIADEGAEKTSSSAVDEPSSTENHYRVKWIDFNGVMYSIVTQNENGPCPLVAVINVLLLKGQLSLPRGTKSVPEKYLLQQVADCVIRLKPKGLNENDALNYEHNISDVLSLVPSIPRGLDVNVQFNGVDKFEYTTASAFFDTLGIPLLHGWVVDPGQTELARILGTLGYNQVAELLVSGERSTDLCILENFLHSSASQLTVYGLFQLHSTLSDGQLAVLFRNNHFNTLYKNKDELYVLVTDQGFINEPSVVWETLNSVDGSSTFVNASFSKSKPTNANEDSDHLLALALQQEENNKQQQQEQNINTATGTAKTKKSSSSLSLHSKSGSTPAQTPSSTASSSKHSTKSSKLDECAVL